MGTDCENMFQEICASQKQMLGIDKKTFFYLKIFIYTIYDT